MTSLETQTFPFPEQLAELVSSVKYRPGWHFSLQNIVRDKNTETGEVLSEGLTLIITTLGYNSYHPEEGESYRVKHFFPVPPATYNYQSWRWWLFEMCKRVDDHEAMEFFEVEGGKVYAPNHGPGWDPYLVTELTTAIDRRTRFTGEVLDELSEPPEDEDRSGDASG